MVNIISFLFLLSPPFFTNLYDFRRSHDNDVVDRYSDFATSLTISTDVGGLEGVGIVDIDGVVNVVGKVDDVGAPILENAIGDVAVPNVGIGDVTVLFIGIVQPDVALTASGVETIGMFNMFPDPFDASATVTLVEIIRSSCLRCCWHLNYSILSFNAC